MGKMWSPLKTRPAAAKIKNRGNGGASLASGWRNEMGRDIYGWSFLVFFLALSTVIIAFNCRSFFKYANSDVAGEFLYMKKVYETKNPLTPAYSNSNELFLSRPWLIFCLFYAFGQNLIVSAKLTVITTYLLEVFSAGYLFRKLGWKWPEILIALSALFGLMNIRISTVLFCGSNAYSLFFVGLTLSLGMLAEAGRRGKMRPVCTAVYLTIAFYFGLCGIRMLLFLYLPIFLVECIRTVRKNLDGEPIKMNSIIWKRGGGTARKCYWYRDIPLCPDTLHALCS